MFKYLLQQKFYHLSGLFVTLCIIYGHPMWVSTVFSYIYNNNIIDYKYTSIYEQ